MGEDKKGVDQKCAICGEKNSELYKCGYCGKLFCVSHYHVIMHNCPEWKPNKPEPIPSDNDQDIQSHDKSKGINNLIKNLRGVYNRSNPFIRYGLILLIAIAIEYLIIVNTQVIGANDETTMMLLDNTIAGIEIILGIIAIYALFRLAQQVIQVLLRRRVSFWITTIAIILICGIGYIAYPSLSNSSLFQDPIVGRYDGQLNTANGGYWNAVVVFDSNGKVTISRTSILYNTIPIVDTTVWRKDGNHYDIIFTNEKIYVTYDPSNDCISFPNTRLDGYTYDFSGALYGNKKYK